MPAPSAVRVLVASNTYPPKDISGVASLAQELARALDRAGHSVDVVTREAAWDDAYAVPVGGSKGQYPLRAALRYLRLERRLPYDLVHVHESDGALIVLAHWLRRRLGRLLRRPWGRGRLVATLQVSYDRERAEVRPLHARDGRVLSTPTAAERRFARRALVHAVLGRMMVRLCDRVVAPSEVTRGELESDYGARDVAVLYNGIDLRQVSSTGSVPVADTVSLADTDSVGQTSQSSGDGPIVLYAGRLRTRKAVAFLLEAFQRVRAEHPEARLWVVGDGPQEEALHAQARRLGLTAGSDELSASDGEPGRHGPLVRFLGALDRDDLLALYARVDVYCLPSTYEGFPVAILEAMAAGLPIVATTVSGIPEAVVDGATGLLVPPCDDVALAAALGRLLADAELRRRLGAAGRRRVHERFGIETITADHLALWQDLTHPDDSRGRR
ncbi:MAG: glycosyltransferase family 4 protein [Acidobacteriota bacterium]